MHYTIEVRIYKQRDQFRLNLLFGRWSCAGVSWKSPILYFSGRSWDEADSAAQALYRELETLPTWFKKVRAQMRHRLGRNGHNWPYMPDPDALTQHGMDMFIQAAKMVAARPGAYSKKWLSSGHSSSAPSLGGPDL